jgi:hypothetical protein
MSVAFSERPVADYEIDARVVHMHRCAVDMRSACSQGRRAATHGSSSANR